MTAQTSEPERRTVSYMTSGVKLISTTTDENDLDETNPPISFSYIFSSSRQEDHFAETMESYQQAPGLVYHTPTGQAQQLEKENSRANNIDFRLGNEISESNMKPHQPSNEVLQQSNELIQSNNEVSQTSIELAEPSNEHNPSNEELPQTNNQHTPLETNPSQQNTKLLQPNDEHIHRDNELPQETHELPQSTDELSESNKEPIPPNNKLSQPSNEFIQPENEPDNELSQPSNEDIQPNKEPSTELPQPSSASPADKESLDDDDDDDDRQSSEYDYGDYARPARKNRIRYKHLIIEDSDIRQTRSVTRKQHQAAVTPHHHHHHHDATGFVDKVETLVQETPETGIDPGTGFCNPLDLHINSMEVAILGDLNAQLDSFSDTLHGPDTSVEQAVVLREESPLPMDDYDAYDYADDMQSDLEPRLFEPDENAGVDDVGADDVGVDDVGVDDVGVDDPIEVDQQIVSDGETAIGVEKRLTLTAPPADPVDEIPESHTESEKSTSNKGKKETVKKNGSGSGRLKLKRGRKPGVKTPKKRSPGRPKRVQASTKLYNSNAELPTQQPQETPSNMVAPQKAAEEPPRAPVEKVDMEQAPEEVVVELQNVEERDLPKLSQRRQRKSDHTSKSPRKKARHATVALPREAPVVTTAVVAARLDKIPKIHVSTVGVIPTPQQQQNMDEEPFTGNATLLKRLEPTKFIPSTDSLAVFSGPRYCPEKYQLKPITSEDTQSRRKRTHINEFFQVAMEDGSFFSRYEEYNEKDMVNFRHAYNPKNHELTPLDPEPVVTTQTIPKEPVVPQRRWHKPASPVSTSLTLYVDAEEEEDEDEFIDVEGPYPAFEKSIFEKRTVAEAGTSDVAKSETVIVDVDGGDESDDVFTPPPPPPPPQQPLKKKKMEPLFKKKRKAMWGSPKVIPTVWVDSEETETDSLPEDDGDYVVDENEEQEAPIVTKYRPDKVLSAAPVALDEEDEVYQLDEDEDESAFVFQPSLTTVEKKVKKKKKTDSKPKQKEVGGKKKKEPRLKQVKRRKRKVMVPVETKKTKLEDLIVLPSDNLLCSICLQHDFPKETWDRLQLPENYLETLENTKDKRQPGHTGTAHTWDPRVYIKCSECFSVLHCGCPYTPIKAYPSRGQKFFCVRCDTTEEIVPVETKRSKRSVNYKV